MDAQITAAIIGACSAIAGVIVTSIINFASEILKSKKEEKIYYKRRKEEAYIKCINFIINIELSENLNNCNITREIIMQMLSELRLYASYNVYNKFDYLAHNLINKKSNVNRDKIDEFITILRDELKIKDK